LKNQALRPFESQPSTHAKNAITETLLQSAQTEVISLVAVNTEKGLSQFQLEYMKLSEQISNATGGWWGERGETTKQSKSAP
jgi:hypothetical protein